MLNDAPSSSPTPWVFAPNIMSLHLIAAIALAAMPAGRGLAADAWRVDTPIVSYWAGPGYTNGGDLTDAAAKQLAEGGWNLMWCREKELDIAQRHGLRGLLTADTFTHTSLHHADKHAELDGVIERVRKHPAFYACHLSDEPPAEHFPGFAHIVGYLREREFAAIAKELQPLKSQGVFHAGMQPPDITPLLPDSAFTFGPPIAPAHRTRPSHPPIAPADYKPGARVEGVALSRFGSGEKTTHLFVVNLDCKTGRAVTLVAPGALEIFDATTGQWPSTNASRVELRQPGGDRKLLRVAGAR